MRCLWCPLQIEIVTHWPIHNAQLITAVSVPRDQRGCAGPQFALPWLGIAVYPDGRDQAQVICLRMK